MEEPEYLISKEDDHDFLSQPIPSAPNAEKAFLGAIILDCLLIAQAIDLLNVSDFYVPSHQLIFQAMIDLFQAGSPIDTILIAERLRKQGSLERVGGVSYITNLTYGLPHFSNLEHYAQLIKDEAVRRNIIHAARVMTEDAFDKSDLSEVVAQRAAQSIFEIVTASSKPKFEKIGTLIQASIDRAEAIQHHGQQITGIPSGYTDLDAMTLGWQDEDFIIVAARPSMGKTALALALAQNAAIREGRRVALFSLEMSKKQVSDRILCSEARIDSMRLRSGFLTAEEWGRIEMAQIAIDPSDIYVDDTPGISTPAIKAKAQRLSVEHGKLHLIIVDYLQLMSGHNRRPESRQQEISQISRELKGIAKDMKVPLIALSQLNRGPENRPNHRPQLADLRESGAIEQDADVVAFIYREDEYKTDKAIPDTNIAEILLEKQRNGPTGPVLLRFDPSTTSFDNLYTGAE